MRERLTSGEKGEEGGEEVLILFPWYNASVAFVILGRIKMDAWPSLMRVRVCMSL